MSHMRVVLHIYVMSVQAVKIMVMLTAFMAVLWCLGLLPSQQEQAALLQEQAAKKPAAAEDAHTEL